jgi:hypothetical protein
MVPVLWVKDPERVEGAAWAGVRVGAAWGETGPARGRAENASARSAARLFLIRLEWRAMRRDARSAALR